MKDEDRVRINSDFLQMYESLQKAVSNAGGTMLSSYGLSTMTAMEFLSYLASNDIQFLYVKDVVGYHKEDKELGRVDPYKLKEPVSKIPNHFDRTFKV